MYVQSDRSRAVSTKLIRGGLTAMVRPFRGELDQLHGVGTSIGSWPSSMTTTPSLRTSCRAKAIASSTVLCVFGAGWRQREHPHSPRDLVCTSNPANRLQRGTALATEWGLIGRSWLTSCRASCEVRNTKCTTRTGSTVIAKASEPTTRKSVTLPDRLWAEISEFRHRNRIASEAEAVRRLLQAGLDAENQDAPRTPRRR